MKKDNYPLYPELPEEGRIAAQELINKFKEQVKKAADDVISDFYCDVAVYIQEDSWQNFRTQIMHGMRNYGNRKIQGEYDFKDIRQSILKEHKEAIISDLNQDMVKEIESLNKTIEFLHKSKM